MDHLGYQQKNVLHKKFKGLIKQIINCRQLLIMIFLPLVFFAIFHYGPMYGLQIAFKDFRLGSGITGSEWVGGSNFSYLFGNRLFRNALRNTIILSFYQIIFVFPIPIILSLMLNEIRILQFKKITQTVIYLPRFVSAVVAAGLVTTFLSPEYGLVNDVIKFFGGEPVYFLIERSYFRGILVGTNIWRNSGWGTIVFLAALSGVDGESLEAAIIDGASRFQRIRYINIPTIMPVIVIMFILNIGSILTFDFETVLNLYNPLVYDVGDVLDTYIFRIGLQASTRNMYSAATAAGLFKSLIGFMMILITNKVANRLSEGEMKIW